MTGRKDTLQAFLSIENRTLDPEDEDLILHVANAFGESGNKIHAGHLPFLHRPSVIEWLNKFARSFNSGGRSVALIDKLTPEVEWVEVTSSSDTHRKELNIFTGEIRDGEALYNPQKHRDY